MGAVNSTGSRLEKALAADLPETERYFGLDNYGSTCYANSVLQALYWCEPFRRAVLEYDRGRRLTPARPAADEGRGGSGGGGGGGAAGTLRNTIRAYASDSSSGSAATSSATAAGQPAAGGSSSGGGGAGAAAAGDGDDTSMLSVLADLFTTIAGQKKRAGSVPPKAFIAKLRQVNDQFSGYMHQDAHEFLLFLLNDVVEGLNREVAEKLRRKSLSPAAEPPRTFIHALFEGQTTSETRCLCCETVTRRIEPFFVLSVEIEQNSSLTACLRNFSSTELLEKQDKFDCAVCCSLQEAELRKRIKRLPQVLALHLKRFKYIEQYGKAKKLSYRVVFPLELRLYNTSDDAEDPDRLYSLFAVVVHVGSGPSQGHYVTLVRSFGHWLLFDDDAVELKDESELQAVFGVTQDSSSSTEAGFILFYQATDGPRPTL
jgi:ubiquitin carboxyl-terminal hydrolase 12/46